MVTFSFYTSLPFVGELKKRAHLGYKRSNGFQQSFTLSSLYSETGSLYTIRLNRNAAIFCSNVSLHFLVFWNSEMYNIYISVFLSFLGILFLINSLFCCGRFVWLRSENVCKFVIKFNYRIFVYFVKQHLFQ